METTEFKIKNPQTEDQEWWIFSICKSTDTSKKKPTISYSIWLDIDESMDYLCLSTLANELGTPNPDYEIFKDYPIDDFDSFDIAVKYLKTKMGELIKYM